MTVIKWTSARSECTMDGVSFILDRKRVIFIAACETPTTAVPIARPSIFVMVNDGGNSKRL